MEELLWKDDQIQFARLVAEIGTVVEFSNSQKEAICETTGLTWEEVCELFERADTWFEAFTINLVKFAE